MHLAAPRSTLSENCVACDDHLSRNEFGFGMVLQNFLAMLTGGLGHASPIVSHDYSAELPWPRLPDTLVRDESKKDRVAIRMIEWISRCI